MTYQETNICGLDCRIGYPECFDPSKKYPTLIFLHGIGSRGDMEKLKTNPFFTDIAECHPDLPMILVAPLDPPFLVWFDLMETLGKFTDEIWELPYVDKSHFYLMGASMGGYGTWMLGMHRHEKFAAIVPICGGGTYWDVGRLKNIPIWAFHGALDKTVSPDESRRMVDAVNKRGGSAKLTFYPERDHNAWNDTYRNPEVFAWLLSHSKSNIDGEKGTVEHYDPKNFG